MVFSRVALLFHLTFACLLCVRAAPPASGATPAEQLTVPAGFRVELLRSGSPREGSWVALTFDDRGRLYLSPQNAAADGGLFRLTLTPEGRVAKFEPVPIKVSGAMGLLWAYDSLYFSGDGPEGHGIYRLRDTDGDDVLDTAALFKAVPGGGGEHGAHGIVLGPDGMLYFTHGNATPPPQELEGTLPLAEIEEDTVLNTIRDPVATFFDKVKVPYGQILRTDPDGKKWELFAFGLRNAYDLAFNADGELFTYESDMEWDVGLPWYRPTRILHIPRGAEFGFREGSAKWPEYYEDSVPSIAPMGLGSPTGMQFATRSHFPERYRKALFALDWTYGRILAVHVTPKGASYTATSEDFLKGKGMPLTDMEFGPDGALYFITGGRGTQSGLYRVSYAGPPETAPAPVLADPAAAQARDLRHQLETLFYAPDDPAAIPFLWPHLGSEDRAIRYAARVALERQPLDRWRARALAETEPRAGLTALLALIRRGSNADRDPVLEALEKFHFENLDEGLKLLKLRVMEISHARHGSPKAQITDAVIDQFSPFYPADSFALNRELSQVLSRLPQTESNETTLALMEKSTVPEEQIWYAHVLADSGQWQGFEWERRRERYFRWFARAQDFRGGNSFGKFLEKIRDRALEKVPKDEQAALLSLTQHEKPSAPLAAPAAPRPFVRAWTVAELTPELDQVARLRSFTRGRDLFASTLCLSCHHLGKDGGNVGPDLSAIGSRFNRHDLLEAIIEPSKAISEQYASFIVTTRKGETIAGQIAEENNDNLTLVTDPLAGTRRTIGQTQVASKEISPVSLMPPGLLNSLTKEEIFDLLAYLENAGDPHAPAFAPTP